MMPMTRPLRPGRYVPAVDSDLAARKALYPLADQIRTMYFYAARAHYEARHGVPSRFGERTVPRWDGGKGPDGNTYQPIWYKIARVVLDRGISPEDLISAAFYGWDRKDPPWPSNLLSESTVARAINNPGVTAEDTAQALRVQRQAWKTAIFLYRQDRGCDFATAAHATLRNRRLDLSSVFRYCMAVDGGDRAVAAEFEDGALVQYVYNRRAYDRGWGDTIPDQLRLRADRLPSARGDDV
jgi:hypothetical protein